jgi:hypothetical protein
MPCGHYIGTESITLLVRSLIDTNKYEIRCPFLDENDSACNTQWDFKICRKIGVFTNE